MSEDTGALGAYGVLAFCKAHGDMCRSTFYKEVNDGHLDTMKVRGRRMVSFEAAAAWRRLKEKEAVAERKVLEEEAPARSGEVPDSAAEGGPAGPRPKAGNQPKAKDQPPKGGEATKATARPTRVKETAGATA